MVGNRLVPLSSREVFKILLQEGFRQVGGGKSGHFRFEKIAESGRIITVSVPVAKKDIPVGTLRSIIRHAKLPVKIFIKGSK